MRAKKLIGVTLLVLVLPAMAAELAGVEMPETLEVGGKRLQLNGLGLREATWLKVDVYVAGLYLEERTADAQSVLDAETHQSIQIVFVRKVKRRSITEAWEQGFKKNAGPAVEQLQERIERLNSWMEDFAPGDTMGFHRLPGAGAQVAVRGKLAGTIEGDDFARALWSIWLGDRPPNPGLKRGMLGID
jgi:hypothetical protein